MFKVENLNQINSFTYNPISRENKYKYIILDESHDYKKYEIGKRYKQEIVFYNDLFDIPSYKLLSKKFKIMEIKIFNISPIFDTIVDDFKIIREINYLDLLDSDDIVENMISAIKNHEEIILNAFLDSKETVYLEIIINSGVYKYSDKIIAEYINGKIKNEKIISNIIKTYGHNKDLDIFINDDSFLIQKEVLNIGRPQDLDLMQSKNKMSNNELRLILNNRRKKDIEHYSKICNSFFKDTINEMIIKKYNDDFINDCINTHYGNSILMECIVEYANKKQLDILVKHKSAAVRLAVAKREYKEHLNKLINDYNKHVYEFVSEKLKELNCV